MPGPGTLRNPLHLGLLYWQDLSLYEDYIPSITYIEPFPGFIQNHREAGKQWRGGGGAEAPLSREMCSDHGPQSFGLREIHSRLNECVYLSPKAAITKYQRFGDLDTRHFFFDSSGSQMSKIKVPAR